MKSSHSLALGIVSSLLLSVGLTRAAEKFDVSARHSQNIASTVAAPGCDQPCNLAAPGCDQPCNLAAPGCDQPCNLV